MHRVEGEPMKLDRQEGLSVFPEWHKPLGTAGACPLAGPYDEVRRLTEQLCGPLAIEDYGIQSMPQASPAKWHLAHTSWFFETFVLAAFDAKYRPFHPQFGYLFNSYYNALGERWPRAQRGLLSRPTVEEVYRYRAHVDRHVRRLFREGGPDLWGRIGPNVTLGLHHEQQHQELLLTDLKHAFALNPLRPVYRERPQDPAVSPVPLGWADYPAGTYWIGHDGDGFAYDNETPRHRVFLGPFRLATRLTTSGEYRAFLEGGGYERPELWLSDGWDARRAHGWQAPLYWEKQDGNWWSLTLGGWRPVADADPVCHVSYYEADAFARWAGGRLPTEAEWEIAVQDCPLAGNLLDGGRLHPRPLTEAPGAQPAQLFGDTWEWTGSPYVAYPGYRMPAGALGEYNAKFTCNQMVLRGGSCATPRTHLRRSYRNFFPPEARWQFTGIRLAQDP
jgi:ergothioneine biosynthesis protein EgtB